MNADKTTTEPFSSGWNSTKCILFNMNHLFDIYCGFTIRRVQSEWKCCVGDKLWKRKEKKNEIKLFDHLFLHWLMNKKPFPSSSYCGFFISYLNALMKAINGIQMFCYFQQVSSSNPFLWFETVQQKLF